MEISDIRKMNGNDITGLSYKELQALALTYRVPGNIKKKLLIKVLQAAKSGNEREVARLLHDLKQTRKKRTRKTKPGKLGITSTPLHSPDYTMADDFYSPQQQPPYQWVRVGAEEEIGAREDDAGISQYEEFRRFLLRRIQRECRVYDTNNNRIRDSSVVDLRTGTDPLDVNAFTVEKYDCTRPNIITVDENNACVFPTASPIEYQILEDPNATAHGSVLLKKMLQAPVGANLGEIASPVIGDYRIWSSDRYQSENILDNSDTLTAESESISQENLPAEVDCYGFVDNVRTTEYILQEANFVGTAEETAVQLSNVLTSENHGQYRYAYPGNDTHQNYQDWSTPNTAGIGELSCVAPPETDSTGAFRTMYYDGADLNNGLANNEPAAYQFHTNENIVYGNTNPHVQFTANVTEENQYYHTNMIPGIQCEPLDTYYLQNLAKQGTTANDSYFVRTNSQTDTMRLPTDPMDRQTYPVDFQNEINSARQQAPTYHNHSQLNVPSAEYLKGRIDDDVTIGRNNHFQKETGSSGVLDPFIPKHVFGTSTNSCLENILNFTTSRSVDYGKIEQTCCVYCYTTPVVAEREAMLASSSSREKGFVAEERQHSFSACWLVYDDSSFGMRMANLKINSEGENNQRNEDENKNAGNSLPDFNGNSEIREPIDTSDESTINDIWIHDYSGLQTTVKENAVTYENSNDCHTDTLEFPVEKSTDDIAMRAF